MGGEERGGTPPTAAAASASCPASARWFACCCEATAKAASAAVAAAAAPCACAPWPGCGCDRAMGGGVSNSCGAPPDHSCCLPSPLRPEKRCGIHAARWHAILSARPTLHQNTSGGRELAEGRGQRQELSLAKTARSRARWGAPGHGSPGPVAAVGATAGVPPPLTAAQLVPGPPTRPRPKLNRVQASAAAPALQLRGVHLRAAGHRNSTGCACGVAQVSACGGPGGRRCCCSPSPYGMRRQLPLPRRVLWKKGLLFVQLLCRYCRCSEGNPTHQSSASWKNTPVPHNADRQSSSCVALRQHSIC